MRASAAFPPSIYLAKSMTRANLTILRIKRKLGHQVAAWDEEAVVHYPQQIYYAQAYWSLNRLN